MAQSLSKCWIHLVFSTKDRHPYLMDRDVRAHLHAYLGQACNQQKCQVRVVNGVADHVHLLFLLHRTVPLATLVGNLKRNSSKWLKSKGPAFMTFQWQNGYGAFSVSEKAVDYVTGYIRGQEAHHAGKSFKDEYLELLAYNHLEYDERYLWD